jgi:hypothetical protein
MLFQYLIDTTTRKIPAKTYLLGLWRIPVAVTKGQD